MLTNYTIEPCFMLTLVAPPPLTEPGPYSLLAGGVGTQKKQAGPVKAQPAYVDTDEI